MLIKQLLQLDPALQDHRPGRRAHGAGRRDRSHQPRARPGHHRLHRGRHQVSPRSAAFSYDTVAYLREHRPDGARADRLSRLQPAPGRAGPQARHQGRLLRLPAGLGLASQPHPQDPQVRRQGAGDPALRGILPARGRRRRPVRRHALAGHDDPDDEPRRRSSSTSAWTRTKSSIGLLPGSRKREVETPAAGHARGRRKNPGRRCPTCSSSSRAPRPSSPS